jgi:hypothetical protein
MPVKNIYFLISVESVRIWRFFCYAHTSFAVFGK